MLYKYYVTGVWDVFIGVFYRAILVIKPNTCIENFT